MSPWNARLVAPLAAAAALAAMAGALAVTGGRDAEQVRIEAARRAAIELAREPAMRTSYLGSTVVDRLEASRRARERAGAEARAASARPALRAAWRGLDRAVFPGEQPAVVFEALRQPPFGRVRVAAPAWLDVRGARGAEAAQAGGSVDAWPRSGWAPTATTVVGVSSATPTR